MAGAAGAGGSSAAAAPRDGGRDSAGPVAAVGAAVRGGGAPVACAGVLVIAAMGARILHVRGTQAQLFTASNVLVQEVILVISMFIAATIMSKIERRPMGQYGLPAREAFRHRFWTGVMWGFFAITATLLMIAALPNEGAVLRVFFGLWVSGQMKLRRITGNRDMGGKEKTAA